MISYWVQASNAASCHYLCPAAASADTSIFSKPHIITHQMYRINLLLICSETLDHCTPDASYSNQMNTAKRNGAAHRDDDKEPPGVATRIGQCRSKRPLTVILVTAESRECHIDADAMTVSISQYKTGVLTTT